MTTKRASHLAGSAGRIAEGIQE